MRYVIGIFLVALCFLDVLVNHSRVTGPVVREVTRVAHEISIRL